MRFQDMRLGEYKIITGDCDQWIELYKWIKLENPEYIKYLYRCPLPHNVYGQPLIKLNRKMFDFFDDNCIISFVSKWISDQKLIIDNSHKSWHFSKDKV